MNLNVEFLSCIIIIILLALPKILIIILLIVIILLSPSSPSVVAVDVACFYYHPYTVADIWGTDAVANANETSITMIVVFLVPGVEI